MKKKFIKKINEATRKVTSCMFVLIYTLVQILSPLTVYALDNNDTPSKGEVRNGTITVSDDNVEVIKTVTNALDENGNVIEGRYKVSFDITGKETEIATTSPLYAVIVFDTSGSMICDYSIGAYSFLATGNTYHYEAADGQKIVCKNSHNNYVPEGVIANKWESAINGAQNFAKEIMEIDDSQVSVVTFSGSANTATNWYKKGSSNLVNGTIPDSVFSHPYGATNLSKAI